MLHAKLLRYLDEVARCGSIRKASTRLNVASSAINRQILALEAEIMPQPFSPLPSGVSAASPGAGLVTS